MGAEQICLLGRAVHCGDAPVQRSRRRRIEVEWLRELAVEYDAYNVANFAQNMKKDSAFFKEVRDRDGSRIGWKLTAAGLTQAKELATQALEPA